MQPTLDLVLPKIVILTANNDVEVSTCATQLLLIAKLLQGKEKLSDFNKQNIEYVIEAVENDHNVFDDTGYFPGFSFCVAVAKRTLSELVKNNRYLTRTQPLKEVRSLIYHKRSNTEDVSLYVYNSCFCIDQERKYKRQRLTKHKEEAVAY